MRLKQRLSKVKQLHVQTSTPLKRAIYEEAQIVMAAASEAKRKLIAGSQLV